MPSGSSVRIADVALEVGQQLVLVRQTPVNSDPRAAVQMEVGVKAQSKRTPCAASRSALGVRHTGLP